MTSRVSNLHPAAANVLPGSPTWIDLATPKPSVTKDFYQRLFGWEFGPPQESQSGQYTYAYLDGNPVAGIYTGPPRHSGPWWMVYLAVTDTHHSANLVQRYGGHVLDGPSQLPDGSAYLMADDPGGALFGLWRPTRSWSFDFGAPGTLAWAELVTREPRRSDYFYAQLFGYGQRQIGDRSSFDYSTWSLDGDTVLGRFRMGRDYSAQAPEHWAVYFEVDPVLGTDVTAEYAGRLGAQVIAQPFYSIFGRQAVLQDVTGAAFSLIDPTRGDEEYWRSAVDDPYDD